MNLEEQLIAYIKKDLPDKQMFKTMRLGYVNVDNVYEQLIKSFGLESLLKAKTERLREQKKGMM